MNRRMFVRLWVCLFFLLIILPSPIFAQDAPPDATIRLLDVEGGVVGFVKLTQQDTHVKVDVDVSNLPAGFHGIQIHTIGLCDAGDTPYAAAGTVLGADTADHPNQSGDLPPVLVLQDGTGSMSVETDRFTIADLQDADGSSVIIYTNSSNFGNIPERYGVSADETTLTSGDMGAGIACGALRDIDSIVAAEGNLWAVDRLPLDMLPATIYRGENAEEADMVLTLDALNGAQINGRVEGASAGPIGEVTMDGDFLVFTFNHVDYNVFPLELPGGFSLGQQTINLDPEQTSTIRVNLTTGEIQREFHWIQTASDVLYNGVPSIPLGDTARTRVAEVRNLGNNRYSVRMLTNWRSVLEIETWEVAGIALPGGNIEATADFDGVYTLDFNR